MSVNKNMKKTKRGKDRFKIPTKGRGKECLWCKEKKSPTWQDYVKMADSLSVRARIISAPITGVCMKHQRQLASAIKQARHLGLLPFTTKSE
jgi:small subunit ribosomal protein S18